MTSLLAASNSACIALLASSSDPMPRPCSAAAASNVWEVSPSFPTPSVRSLALPLLASKLSRYPAELANCSIGKRDAVRSVSGSGSAPLSWKRPVP